MNYSEQCLLPNAEDGTVLSAKCQPNAPVAWGSEEISEVSSGIVTGIQHIQQATTLACFVRDPEL